MIWTARQRGALVGIFLGVVIYFGVRAWRERVDVAYPFEGDGARAGELADRVNPNEADWATLAALPQIGPKTARKIVEERERWLRERPGEAAFQRLEDLLRVEGIGEATLRTVEPYLVFSRGPATQIR